MAALYRGWRDGRAMKLKDYKEQILTVADLLNDMNLTDEEQSFVAAAVAMMSIQRDQQRRDKNAKPRSRL